MKRGGNGVRLGVLGVLGTRLRAQRSVGRRGVAASVFAIALACCDAPTEAPVPVVEPELPRPCTVADACRARLPVGNDAFLPHYATHRLLEGAAGYPDPVRRAIVVVHGNERNADDYFERVIAAAVRAGELAATVIVAPHLQTRDDSPAADEPYWTSAGWKRGYPSEGGASPPVSSYQVVDTLVARLRDPVLFPDLRRIVITGHSAGGQLAHRYAAGTPSEGQAAAVRYVVANPSTYLYPTPMREWANEYLVPDTIACPDYDDWHYGLRRLNPYMAAGGADSARVRLLRRDVIILAGDRDTGSASLDQSCGANYQGLNRYQRALALVRTMEQLFPGEHRHRQVVVSGVGHSSAGMYQSPEGIEALFGW